MICLKQTLMDSKEVWRSHFVYIETASKGWKHYKIQRTIHTEKNLYIDDEFFMSFVGFFNALAAVLVKHTREEKITSTTSSTSRSCCLQKNHINPACEKIENYIQFMTTEVLCDAVWLVKDKYIQRKTAARAKN